MVNLRTLNSPHRLRTLNSPHRDTVFNALPSQNLQQVGESVARRPSTKSAVAHADTMVYLENISKQPTYSLMKPIMAMSQMRLDSSTDGHSDAVPEGLLKLKDYRRGIFVGKSGYGQVFRHESRHSSEVFAVKVVAFPEIIPAGRKNIKGKTAELFDRKMAYVKREADILLKLDHVSSRGYGKPSLADMLSSDSYFEHTESFTIQKE